MNNEIPTLINQNLYPEVDIWHRKLQFLLLQYNKVLIVQRKCQNPVIWTDNFKWHEQIWDPCDPSFETEGIFFEKHDPLIEIAFLKKIYILK